ncbi:MAG: CopG family transcriptional regulator [Chloroflexi bacterium]|nr:CopG family transcriptional regulator [Chloroflexota bacterium]
MGVRRQIYLQEKDNRLLEEQSRRTGLSVSELVRQAIHQCYGAGHRLSWDEVFAGAVQANTGKTTELDPWVYDSLYDAEIDDLIEAQIAEQIGKKQAENHE